MKKRITFALIIIMVAALFAPALTAYAGINASDIEAQIAKAERELEEDAGGDGHWRKATYQVC